MGMAVEEEQPTETERDLLKIFGKMRFNWVVLEEGCG
jgi:hypothetical protein